MNKIAILTGVGMSLCLLAVGIAGAVWWILTIWKAEMYLAGYLSILYGLTAWVGGLGAGYKANHLPWRHGAIAGGVYALLLAMLGWSIVPGLVSGITIIKSIAMCISIGSLGGVVGQNLRRARRRRQKQALGLQKF